MSNIPEHLTAALSAASGSAIQDEVAAVLAALRPEDAHRVPAWVGQCVCNRGPDAEGPDETCPQHGRSYLEWIERGDRLDKQLTEARAEVERLKAERDKAQVSDVPDRRCIVRVNEVESS